MDKTIVQTIKNYYSSLSPGQKKVASFIVEHREESAFLTAYQLGKKVGVSETTVIRLAFVLGYRGFSHLQDLIRSDWLGANKASLSSIREKTGDSNDMLFREAAEQECRVFGQLLDQLDTDEMWKAVESLTNAKKVYIGSFGSSHSVGYWFYHALKQLRNSVYLSGPTGLEAEDLYELDVESVAVIFSFPRYRKEGKDLADFARKAGATIITFTNKQLSPVGRLSDITITTEEKMESDFHSIASAISVSDMVIQAITQKNCENIRERQQALELLFAEQGLFLE